MEGIVLDSTELGVKVRVNAKSFSMMNRLRYLVIKNGNLPNGLECLPNSLRILNWTGYPLKSLPSDFNPEKLLELNMCHSCIEHFPLEIESLYNLKTVKLSNSLNLINTPNFKGMPHLELLFLEGCTRLYEVDPGIEVLEKLTVLNLKDCKNLVHFASSVSGLKSLKFLNLSGCSKLKKLPNDMGHLESLEELHVNGTSIRELPSSIGRLERLLLLEMEDCKDLMCLPISVGGLKSLKIVNIYGCSKLNNLPEELGCLACLEEVDASGTSIQELPCSIGMLEGLVSMSLRDCKHLVCLPSSVGGLKSLKYLNLSGCLKLDKLPEELGHIAHLEEVDASETSIRELPCSIGMLEGLVSMSLRDCKHLVCLPGSVGGLKSLKYLNLSGCSKIDKLPDELGLVACLEKFDVSGSGIREVPSSIGLLKNLKELSLVGCKGQSPKSWNMMLNPFQLLRKRSRIPAGLSLASLSGLHSLTKLIIFEQNQFVRLPESIGQLSRLEWLHLDSCCKLQTLPELPTRSWVNISNCISLDTLSNRMGKFMGVNCFKMVENESCKSTELSLLTCYMKFQYRNYSVHCPEFHFVAPGDEIPEWYNHQSVGSLITVALHPGWFTNKWRGFAGCAVFRLVKQLPPREWSIGCVLIANGISLGHIGLAIGGQWGQPVLDHIWFFYVNRDGGHYNNEWQDIYHQLQFSFQFYDFENGQMMNEELVQVKKCGVRMVYEEDVEELWQTLLKQRNTKRGLQHYDDDDATSSRTATGASQEEEEEPHPKRFKRLELDGAGASDQKHD
ncbi:putative leucine-rich repeat domain, L domain-containing protein [Rosa chinensis]|uniref:Putative leucine-rich repeat domain, L domain-containing protein n=1 Tax=Rosa chinensis TaxID=74649 RepID=A0A2P6PKG7_ROSCH|nr:putative leucine-rich repeat domain, L domain-containing protein [Rosa chinensis]